MSIFQVSEQNVNNLQCLINFIKTCREEYFIARNVEVLERAQATNPKSKLFQTILKRDTYFMGEGGIAGTHDCDVLLIPGLSVTM